MNNDREELRRHLEVAAQLDATARIAYWQKLGTAKIIAAAGELVQQYCEKYAIDLELDRTVAKYHKASDRRTIKL